MDRPKWISVDYRGTSLIINSQQAYAVPVEAKAHAVVAKKAGPKASAAEPALVARVVNAAH